MYAQQDECGARDGSVAGTAYFVGGIEVRPFKMIKEVFPHIISTTGSILPGIAVAINAEKVVRAQRDKELRAILDSATLRYPDGISVVMTLRRKGASTNRIAGFDLWEALMKKAGVSKLPVFLLGARQAVIEKVVARLASELDTPIAGYHSGYFDDDDAMMAKIAASRPAIVAVGLGSPRQERFIVRCHEVWPDAFYMGVGGSFDVHAGEVSRAPALFRRAGAEWLYRLLRQPSRIGRQRALLSYAALHLAGRL